VRIAVTGGAGFIGSHLVDRYVQEGHAVLVIDNLATGTLENVNPAAAFEKIDLLDTPAVRDLLLRFRPDVVSHHAAQIDVRRSVADPVFDAHVNVLGSIGLASAAIAAGVRGMLFASSGGTIYGECPYPAKETTAKAPTSPYAAGKVCVENYLHAMASCSMLRAVSLRYGNVYGPRQNPLGGAGVIAIYAGLMLERNPPTVFGDGTAVRDYVFVDDVVDANLSATDWILGDQPAAAAVDDRAVNVGTGISTSVNELFQVLARACAYSGTPVHEPARTGELQTSRLDTGRASEVLGFAASTSLERGIEKTLAWLSPSRGDQQ